MKYKEIAERHLIDLIAWGTSNQGYNEFEVGDLAEDRMTETDHERVKIQMRKYAERIRDDLVRRGALVDGSPLPWEVTT